MYSYEKTYRNTLLKENGADPGPPSPELANGTYDLLLELNEEYSKSPGEFRPLAI